MTRLYLIHVCVVALLASVLAFGVIGPLIHQAIHTLNATLLSLPPMP